MRRFDFCYSDIDLGKRHTGKKECFHDFIKVYSSFNILVQKPFDNSSRQPSKPPFYRTA